MSILRIPSLLLLIATCAVGCGGSDEDEGGGGSGGSPEGANGASNPLGNPLGTPLRNPPANPPETGSAAALVAPSAATGTAPDADTIILRLHTFKDAANGNISSHTILLPSDWKAEGGAWWPGSKFYRMMGSQEIRLISPDGLEVAIRAGLSAYDFQPTPAGLQVGQSRPQQFSSVSGLPVLYYPAGRSGWQTFFETSVIPYEEDKAISNLRVVEVIELPVLAKAIQHALASVSQRIQRTNVDARKIGIEQRLLTSAVAIRLEYTKNNSRFERIHVIGASLISTRNEYGNAINWMSTTNTAYSAPAGELQSILPGLVALANSLRANAEWSKMAWKRYAETTKTELKGLWDRHAIRVGTMNYIRNLSSAAAKSNSQSEDRSRIGFVEAIHEVETYKSGGESYHLPSRYKHVFSDGQGNFVLTNNSLYKASVDPMRIGDWTKIQPVRR